MSTSQAVPAATTTAATPRNSKLSAYYTRASGSPSGTVPANARSPTTAASPSAASFGDLPTTGGRQAAIQYATRLAQTLSLPDLMSRSSTLRADEDRLAESLHASSRQYYTHLAASHQAAQTARNVAARLVTTPHPSSSSSSFADDLPSTSTPSIADGVSVPPPVSPTAPAVVAKVAACAARCEAVATRLEPTRARVDALEGVQRLTLLLQAAAVLSDTLPLLLDDATSPLCTDATAARARIFHAVRRAATIAPPLRGLADAANAPQAVQFVRAHARLRDVMESVRAGVRDRFFISDAAAGEADDGDGEGEHKGELREGEGEESVHQVLTLKEAGQLSLLLDAPVEEVREDFLRACGRWVCVPRPTEAAVRAAGGQALAVARLQVVYAGAEVIPRLYEAGGWYEALFVRLRRVEDGLDGGEGEEGEDVGALDEFTVWATGAVDDGVLARMRAALAGGVLSGGDVAALESLRKALRGLGDREVASDVGDGEGGVRSRLSAVLEVVGEEGWQGVVTAARAEATAKVCVTVGRVLDGEWRGAGDGGVGAARHLRGVVIEVCETGKMFFSQSEGEGKGGWTVDEMILEVVARKAVQDSVLAGDGDVARMGRACMLCRELARVADGSDVARRLREGADVMGERVQRVVCERVNGMLRALVRLVSLAAGAVGPGAVDVDSIAVEVGQIVRTIEGAVAVGLECGFAGLRRAGSGTDTAGMGMEGLLVGEEEEGRVGRSVVQAWVEGIRQAGVIDGEGVRVLQAVAAVVGEALGLRMVREIGSAAAERCADRGEGEGVVVLDEGAARVLAQKWGLQDGGGDETR